jgi:uncharacterized damage-inducible protein DinB
MNALLKNTQLTLAELNTVVQQLSEAEFSAAMPIFSGASIGMHARHIVEFYQCLLSDFSPNTTIDYESRKRDMRLQTQLLYFSNTIEYLIEEIEKLDTLKLANTLNIHDADMPNATLPSSLARELQYTLEHTVHHAAIMKIGILSVLPTAALPVSFGVAASTLRFQDKTQAMRQ